VEPPKPAPLVNTAGFVHHPVKRRIFRLFQPTLERAMGVKRLNEMYAHASRQADDPVGFSEAALRYSGIRYQIPEAEVEALRKLEGPVVMLCNHPFGGWEALFLISLMGRIRPDFKVMANYMLERIKEIEGNLILVDPFNEDESKEKNVGPMRDAFRYLARGGFLGVFPSGEVAAYNIKTGKIEEPDWNPNIAKLIQKTKATVVPVYFHGTNSLIFHAAGVVNPRLRTGLLIRELVRPTFDEITFAIGDPITPTKTARYETPEALTAYLKSKLYLLGERFPSRKLAPPLRIRTPRLLPLRGKPKQAPIIAPVPPDQLLREVERLRTEGNLLLESKEFDVLIFTAQQAPGLLRELGRQREITFRAVGEGTGDPLDLSDYDMYYDHLLIWDRQAAKIVGSYRLGRVDKIVRELGRKWLYIFTSFHIKKEFFDKIHPIVECSRAIVTQDYQRSFNALALLWQGIGQYINRYPETRWLMGALSISNDFHNTSKEFMVTYLEENHRYDNLVKYIRPKHPFPRDWKAIDKHYRNFKITDVNSLQDLINQVEQDDKKIPVLMRQYLKLGAKCVDFNVDPSFANALDVFLLTDLTQADPETMRKYLGPQGYAAYRAHHSLPPLPE
jgi:putative hemolysin